MQVNFAGVELPDTHDELGQHLQSLPGLTDSFLEDHIEESKHYRILLSGRRAGLASIHGGSLITLFSLAPAYRRFGQEAFQALRRLENVRSAFVPTSDEFYLSHAIDDYRQLAKQAYFFETGPTASEVEVARGCSLQPATSADVDSIRERSGDFFGDVGQHVEAGELFLTNRNAVCVGFGILVQSRFRPGVASIGMFTIEQFRCQGVGTATIALLIEECSRQHLRPVAGCWYYNHLSKRTLERAGMVSPTRLLRMEY